MLATFDVANWMMMTITNGVSSQKHNFLSLSIFIHKTSIIDISQGCFEH